MNDKERCTDAKALLHRRTILKFIAGAPLVATFGFVVSPLLRYLKPTMKPGNFFQASDLPKVDQLVRFQWIDFPEIWTCIPFLLPETYVVFNPEGHEIRKTPGFIVRTAKNEVVAFSRICTYQHRQKQPVNLLMHTADLDCIAQSKNPVLYCPCYCCLSTFDLNDNGRVLGGPAPSSLRRMDVMFDGQYYIVTGLVSDGIA